LHGVKRFVGIPEDPNKSPEDTLPVAVHEVFKAIQIAALHPCYTIPVRVNGRSYFVVTFAWSRKMRIFCIAFHLIRWKMARGYKIRYSP